MSRVPTAQITTGGIVFTRDLPHYEPWPFQEHDVAVITRLLLDKGYAACWHEMGLGKTLIALWAAGCITADRILVITTKTGKVPFEQHSESILPRHHVVRVDSTHELPEIPERAIVLCHYQLFQSRYAMPGLIAAEDWDMVIVDEAHRLKNRQAMWTKQIKKVCKHVPFKLVMTGTPFVNAPDELWSLLNFLDPKTYSSYWRFRGHFCEETRDVNHNTGVTYRTITGFKRRNADGAPTPAGTEEHAIREYAALVRSIGVRRRKRDVKPDMPAVTETTVPVELSAPQRRMYNEMKQVLAMLDQQGQPITAPAVIAQIMRMRQVTAATPIVLSEEWDDTLQRIVQRIGMEEPSGKLDALMDILDGTDTPTVVFSNFYRPLELAAARCQRAGIRYIHMTAADDSSTRYGKVTAFQAGEAQVFFSTIALGGESITLTAADKIVFLDKHWSPAANDQAIARVDRPPQQSPVQVMSIEAKGTIDHYVAGVLDRKRGWFDAIFK